MATAATDGQLGLRRPSKIAGRLGKSVTIGSLLLVGAVLSLGAFRAARQLERRATEVEFLHDSEERVAAFEVTLARSLNAVVALKALFDASERVEPAEFHRFARHLMAEEPVIGGLSWNPRVLDSERESFEESLRRTVRPDFRITERSVEGAMVPAARRESYVVVAYLEPYEGNEPALGYDVASDPLRLRALRAAEQTRGTAVTAGFRLVQEAGDETGFLVFHPFYPEDVGGIPAIKPQGFLVAVLRPMDILEASLTNFAPRGLHFSIHDVTDGGDKILCAHRSRRQTDAVDALDAGAVPFQGFFHEKPLVLPGRRWVVRSAPIEAYVAERRTWVPWGTLGAGLLFTGLVAGFVGHVLSRWGRERIQSERLLASTRRLEREVDEHRKTAVALAQSEDRYRTVGEAMFEGVAISENGIFLEASASLARIFGYDESEIRGEPVLKVVAPEEHGNVTRRIQTGYAKPYETLCVKKDGTVFPVEVCGREMWYKGRKVRVTALRDISERKRLEQEILRGRKLESLGVLAGGLAHDFNNLLTGILGNINLARLQSSEAEPRRVLEQAERAAVRARDLTRQLLTFARGGAPVTKLTAVDDLVREAAVFAARGSNVRCEFHVAAELPGARVDPGQLNQVIQNLVLNAVQATPEGGTVTLVCRNLTFDKDEHASLAAGPYLEIRVEDEGVGIPAENLERVFDPYFTTKESGSGLGLAIVYSIVKRHGGAVEVASEVGRGTTLRILIPASEEPVREIERESENPDAGSGAVLVMDDEPAVREVVGAMLESLGYEVTCVERGEDAIDAYRHALEEGAPFAACIMDLTVPGGMGGQQAVRRLREIDPRVRALVSSGYSNDPVMANYLAHGFCGVIEKPYRLQEIGRALRNAIARPVRSGTGPGA